MGGGDENRGDMGGGIICPRTDGEGEYGLGAYRRIRGGSTLGAFDPELVVRGVRGSTPLP